MSTLTSDQFKAMSSAKAAADIAYAKGDFGAAKTYLSQYYAVQQNVRGYAVLAQQVVDGTSYNGRVANTNVALGAGMTPGSSQYGNYPPPSGRWAVAVRP